MAQAPELRAGGRSLEALYRDLHRGVRRQSLHVREQLPARQGTVQLPGDLQRLQAACGELQRKREDRAVLQDGDGFLPAADPCSLERDEVTVVIARQRVRANARPEARRS